MQNRTILWLIIFLPLIVFGRSKTEITDKELRDHVIFLASDSLKGRKPGTPEDLIAAEYIRSQIAFPQVKFPTENGLQYFEVLTGLELGAKNMLSINDSSYILDKDFYPHSISENGSLDAEVLVAGYGFNILSDTLTWRDYDGVNAAGKWVMILRGDPEPDQLDSPFARHADLRTKVLVAKDAGAAGVLLVSGKIFDEKDEFAELQMNEGHISAGLPVIQLRKSVADRLLAASGLSVDSLETLLNATRSPHSLLLNERIKASVDILRIKSRTQNVTALLPGDDPSLADEIIVLGAHYDHLGFGGPGSGSRRPDTSAIHNGADDNASGVAVAMEIFEKLAAAKKRHRSLLFIAFGAEEMGSLGAKYFIQNPLVDLKKIVFMCNLDMVGRLDSILTLYGTGTAVGMEPLLQELASSHQLAVSMSPEGLGPSDHAAFYAEDIPVLMFFTGMHDDYHTPADDDDLLNYVGGKKIGDMVTDFVLTVANRQQPMAFQLSGPQERYASRRKFKVTLGIMPDVAGQEKRGLRVDAVMPDRPAFRAGMKKGDIIVAMEGKPVANVYEYMHRLSDFKVGQRISIEVLRGEEKMIMIVEL